MINKYYDHSTSNSMLIPRSIFEYYTHEWNRSANPDAKLKDYIVHDAGTARMDEKVYSFLINNMIGTDVINYSYEPKAAYINSQKKSFHTI